jgi:hypothetical protein
MAPLRSSGPNTWRISRPLNVQPCELETSRIPAWPSTYVPHPSSKNGGSTSPMLGNSFVVQDVQCFALQGPIGISQRRHLSCLCFQVDSCSLGSRDDNGHVSCDLIDGR